MRLGIDVGGSKTKIFAKGDGSVSYTITGSFGTAEDRDEVLEPLYREISSLNLSGVDKVVVNLGGKNKTEITKTLEALFPGAEISVYRESEGITALNMMNAYGANVVVMAGTGCIVFGSGKEGVCVVGGWGKEIGDRGCGYSLGMSAIQATLLQMDSALTELSPIAKLISGRDTPLSFSDITEYAAARDKVRSKIPRERGAVAALVPRVVECAANGCHLSASLIERTGREIADGVISAARKIGDREVRVVINGGMTAFSDMWYDAFVSRIVEAHLDLGMLEITNSGIENAILYMLGEEK